MGIDLRFFAKPGENGQIFISLDSLIEFLREEPTSVLEEKHFDALNAVADVLEEQYARIKKIRGAIEDAFSVGSEQSSATKNGSSTQATA